MACEREKEIENGKYTGKRKEGETVAFYRVGTAGPRALLVAFTLSLLSSAADVAMAADVAYFDPADGGMKVADCACFNEMMTTIGPGWYDVSQNCALPDTLKFIG